MGNRRVAIAYRDSDGETISIPNAQNSAITDSENLMRTSVVAGSRHVSPSMRRSELGTGHEAHGYESGTYAAMDTDRPDARGSRGADGRPHLACRERHRFDGNEHVLSLGYDEGTPESALVRERDSRIGVSADATWRHFVCLDGERPGGVRLCVARGGIYALLYRLHRTGSVIIAGSSGPSPRDARRHTRARLRRRRTRIGSRQRLVGTQHARGT